MTLNRIQKELALDSAELRMRQAGELLGLEDGLIETIIASSSFGSLNPISP